MTHHFYLRKNPDWVNKVKYGYVYGTKENLVNRIYDSSSDHSELSQYILIYEFKKNKIYIENNLFKEIDKFISLNSNENYDILETYFSTKFTYLREIQKYKVRSKTKKTNEFIYIDGLPTIEKILKEEYSIFGLELVKIFTQNEMDEINHSCRLRENNYEKSITDLIRNIKTNKQIEKITKRTDWNERLYQFEISEYIKDNLNEHDKIYLELATGAGKSYIIYKTIHFFQPEVIIIFSPRKNINSQNASVKYMSLLDNNYNIYNCSEDSNFEIFYNQTKKLNKNIMIVGCPQMTNKKIYKYIHNFNLKNIFAWFDEAHHTIEKWVNRIDEREIGFFMNDNTKIKKRVFTSASPDVRHIEKYPNILGEHYFPITVKELISLGWLCPIKPYIYDNHSTSVNTSKYILKNFANFNSSYGFSFHNTRENAFSLFEEHASKYYNSETTIKPYLLVGNDYINEKMTIWFEKLGYDFRNIQTFELCNNSIGYVVQQYSMGYDFNKLDFMVFSDPKMSIKDIIQCVGRGTRPDKLGENGTNLYKILKVMINSFIDYENPDNEFNRIEAVLRYLIYDIEIPFEEIEMIFNSTSGEGCKDAKNYKGMEDMKTKILDLLRNGKYSELSEKKCIEILRNNNIHNNYDYIQFIKRRPELNLPKDIHMNYPKFYWEKTYINRRGLNCSPYYRKNGISDKLKQVCEKNEICIHDYEEPERELHKIEPTIPPESLFRFYGGKSNDEYY